MAALVKGKQVLELGSGTGIVGITVACLGAHVTLTDTAAIVQHTRSNVQHNQQLIQQGQGSAGVIALDWGSPALSMSMTMLYDIIIGADLIYAEKDIAPLVETICHIQQYSKMCTVIVAHKHRSSAVLDQLIAKLHCHGIHVHEIVNSGAITIYSTDVAASSACPL